VLIALVGCVHHEPPPPPPPDIDEPAPGEALAYVFRPALDATRHADKPTFLVDGQTIGKLPYMSYTKISLQPGRHRLNVVSGPNDSKDWTTEVGLEVAEGKVSFIAIWNPDQPHVAQSPRSTTPGVTSMCRGSFACGAAAAAILYVISAPHEGSPTPPTTGANLEVVDTVIGTYALGGLAYVAPLADHFPSNDTAAK